MKHAIAFVLACTSQSWSAPARQYGTMVICGLAYFDIDSRQVAGTHQALADEARAQGATFPFAADEVPWGAKFEDCDVRFAQYTKSTRAIEPLNGTRFAIIDKSLTQITESDLKTARWFDDPVRLDDLGQDTITDPNRYFNHNNQLRKEYEYNLLGHTGRSLAMLAKSGACVVVSVIDFLPRDTAFEHESVGYHVRLTSLAMSVDAPPATEPSIPREREHNADPKPD